MRINVLSIQKYPRAIVHVDGDAFFASVCQAMDPSLRGKPVVAGAERGIATAISYEARKYGVKRGMSGREIRRLCPEAVFVSAGYDTYKMFAVKMYEIVRRYTDEVEEYSIDECFADITGVRQIHKMTYREIAEAIKNDLETELGVTFSVGLAPNKVLSKVASNFNKPSGLVCIPASEAHEYLSKISIGDIWGIGSRTIQWFKQLGVHSAYDLAKQDLYWVERNLKKPQQQIWYEMRGNYIYKITTDKKNSYSSVTKTQTFSPISNDPEIIFAELSRNVEAMCNKLRKYNLRAKKFSVFLKSQDFKNTYIEFEFQTQIQTPERILNFLREKLVTIISRNCKYRTTGITCSNIIQDARQLDIFSDYQNDVIHEKVFSVVDKIRERFGGKSIYIASSKRPGSSRNKQKFSIPFAGEIS
jgi:DNA polymerase-4